MAVLMAKLPEFPSEPDTEPKLYLPSKGVKVAKAS